MFKKQDGMAFITIMILMVIFLPMLLILTDIMKTQFFHNLKNSKLTGADYNAEAGANAALANLKWRIEQVQTRIENGLLLPDGTTSYISSDNLNEYIDQHRHAKFITDWLNGFPGEQDFTIVSPTAPYASYNLNYVYNSTNSCNVEVRIADFGKCYWEAGFGNNNAWLCYNYEITSTGKYSSKSDARLNSSKILHLAGNKSIQFHLKRSLSKYNYFASSGLFNGNPVWIFAELSSPARFDGPVHTNGHLYIKGRPGFTAAVTAGDDIFYYNNPPASPSGTVRAKDALGVYYDAPVFSNGFSKVTPVALPGTLAKEQQKSVATGGLDPAFWANDVYQSTTTPAVYVKGNTSISVSSNSFNPNQVIYTFSPTVPGDFPIRTVNVDITTQQQFLIYVDGEISGLSGILQKNAQVTIAADGNLILTNHLIYAGNETTTVIGLISWTGDVLVSKDHSGDINVNASIMAPQGGFGVEDLSGIGDFRGNIYLYGGMIVDHPLPTLSLGGVGYSFNSKYDQNLMDQKAPPYFPGNGRYALEPIDGELFKGVKDSYRIVDPNAHIEL